MPVQTRGRVPAATPRDLGNLVRQRRPQCTPTIVLKREPRMPELMTCTPILKVDSRESAVRCAYSAEQDGIERWPVCRYTFCQT